MAGDGPAVASGWTMAGQCQRLAKTAGGWRRRTETWPAVAAG